MNQEKFYKTILTSDESFLFCEKTFKKKLRLFYKIFLGSFCFILVNWVHFGSFWLTGFLLFWFILVHFGSFWLTGFILVKWVLAILVHFG